MIRVLGRAKVNLRLSIIGRRPDGYHELQSVMQSISLADELTIEPASHSQVTIRWAEGLGGPMPVQPDIVERTVAAARLPGPARPSITVIKRIPIGAGLGGASADAAAALLGLQRFRGNDPPIPLQIDVLARKLGADVSFCLSGGVALARGIGDELTALECPKTLWWVVGICDFALSTVRVYTRFDEMLRSGGTPANTGGRDSQQTLHEALRQGDLEGVAGNLSNDLELAAFDLRPELQELKDTMLGCGALGAVMTGSGSSIIGLCRDRDHADRVAEEAGKAFARVEVASGAAVGAQII